MKLEERAMQLWSVLVLAAQNQQLIGYATLAELTNLPYQMGNFLGPIAEYCDHHNLPQITSIVVSQEHGVPGEYYPGTSAVTDQAKTFVYDWMAYIKKNRVTPESFRPPTKDAQQLT